MSNPFGEQTKPWWRDGDWWWERCFGSTSVAPKRYARIVAVASAFVVFVASGTPHTLAGTIVVGALTMGIPSILLERWWKQRRRYESERLMVLPDTEDRGRLERQS
jgi:hypothetical protein